MKKTLILAFAITIFTAFNAKNLQAQTKDEAILAFNAALELSKTDMAGAVVKMQDVLKMCNTIGTEADTLKMSVTTVLPVWQYNVGNDFINAKKYPQAITAYEKSRDMAIAYSDANIKEKAESMLAKLYVNNGNNLVNAQKYDDAIVQFEKGLKYDPNYSKGYYANAMAYKKKGNNAKMQENMDLAIAAATKENDTVIVKAASNMVGSSLNQEGIAAYNKKSYTEAVTKLNTALGYGFKTKDLYYVLASSNNSLKKYDEAIEAAKSGLAMEESQTNDKLARYYCEIAKAYEGKGDVGNACTNYKKAAYGAFAQFSNAKIKNVLKCQ
jgi:tetratricopeptide (TPR) repeat protein